MKTGTMTTITPNSAPQAAPKPGLHPRNPHRQRYDFPLLCQASPELAAFVRKNEHGDESIDFASPRAVKALNRALLKQFYGIASWDIPKGYLCPPIPGRADYLHHLADLLAGCNRGEIPRGPGLRGLDVGVGANCIYPLLGQHEYGWRFLGSDIGGGALVSAQKNVDANGLGTVIELRQQQNSAHIFKGLLHKDELFDFTLCNPPFHASAAEARAGSQRKTGNLKHSAKKPQAPVLNFGGQEAELWCDGGETAFIQQMVRESAEIPRRCFWFTTLVSKADNLPRIKAALDAAGVRSRKVIPMAQGQKQSRIVAWTFLDLAQQADWVRQRWQAPEA